MLMVNNNAFLPINQSFGSFTQGGQYNLLNNYNFGFYTGDNGAGDYSANIGKNFMLDENLKLKTSVGHMSEQDTWLGNESDGTMLFPATVYDPETPEAPKDPIGKAVEALEQSQRDEEDHYMDRRRLACGFKRRSSSCLLYTSPSPRDS